MWEKRAMMSSGINSSKRFLIIGAGNLGTSLYRLLDHLYPGTVHLYGLLEKNQFQSKYLAEDDYSNFLTIEMVNNLQVIFLAVPDDSLKEATRKLLLFKQQGRIVLHSSGALGSDELDHVRKRGAHCGSWHPMQSFPQKFLPPEHWRNIIFSFEGDEECRPFVEELTEKTDSKLLHLTVDQKLALHIAGVFTANYTTALVNLAEGILINAGIKDIPKNKILAPLLKGVAENLEKAPSDSILSGPAKRGDINVLRKHLQYLRLTQGPADTYLDMVKLLLKNPRFNIPNSAKIEEILTKFL